MGDCEDLARMLFAFLDGELESSQQDLFRAHLEGCSPCFEAVDFEAEVLAKLKVKLRQCQDQPPDALAERIRGALQAEAPSFRPPPPPTSF